MLPAAEVGLYLFCVSTCYDRDLFSQFAFV